MGMQMRGRDHRTLRHRKSNRGDDNHAFYLTSRILVGSPGLAASPAQMFLHRRDPVRPLQRPIRLVQTATFGAIGQLTLLLK